MRLAPQTIVLVLVLLLSVASCGPSTEGDTSVKMSEASLPLGSVWRWTTLTGTDALDVADPSRYTLEFAEDSRYTLRADCNQGAGSYKLEDNQLAMMPGPLTLAASKALVGPGPGAAATAPDDQSRSFGR